MSNILICGDSWACIPWERYYCYYDWATLSDQKEKPNILRKWLKSKEESKHLADIFEWLDFQFISRGHNVNNVGYWSMGNGHQLMRARGYLDGSYINNKPYDLVVWFHTEIPRDWSGHDWVNAEKQGYYEYLQLTARATYNFVSMMKELYPKTKWAIIGGHAPLHEQEKHLLDWAEFRIDNWRQEISGIECPECHVTTFLNTDHKEINSLLSLDQKEIELQKIEQIINACKDKELFYDGVHPNIKPTKELALRIIKQLNLE